jgi:hypothetical protein
MSLYIAHVQDDSFESINLYNCHESDEAAVSVAGINGITGLSNDDDLIFLLPSNIVTSYKFIQNQDLSTQINLANFISEIDSKLVGQVSDNEYVFHNNNVFVVDKKTLLDINTSLSFIKASIYLIPEYLDYYGMDLDEFNAVLAKWVNKDLFEIKNGKWSQKFSIV